MPRSHSRVSAPPRVLENVLSDEEDERSSLFQHGNNNNSDDNSKNYTKENKFNQQNKSEREEGYLSPPLGGRGVRTSLRSKIGLGLCSLVLMVLVSFVCFHIYTGGLYSGSIGFKHYSGGLVALASSKKNEKGNTEIKDHTTTDDQEQLLPHDRVKESSSPPSGSPPSGKGKIISGKIHAVHEHVVVEKKHVEEKHVAEKHVEEQHVQQHPPKQPAEQEHVDNKNNKDTNPKNMISQAMDSVPNFLPSTGKESTTQSIIKKSTEDSPPYHEKVKDAVKFCFDEYASHAWGMDDINAVSGSGHNWIGLGITLLDMLDTLFVVGLIREFRTGVQWVRESLLNPPSGMNGKFFEIAIRGFGGLLSAHSLSGESILLEKAKDLGKILSRNAFPYELQRLPEGDVTIDEKDENREEGSPGYASTNIAEAGSEQLEYRYLAHATNKPELSKHPDLAFQSIVDMSVRSNKGLISSCVSQSGSRSGDEDSSPSSSSSSPDPAPPVNSCWGGISMGGASDSYYEYLIKLYVQNPSAKTVQYRDLWLKTMREMKEKMVQTTDAGHVFLAHLDDGIDPGNVMEHLDCFVPGMLMLGSATLESDLSSPPSGVHAPDITSSEIANFRQLAADIAQSCYDMYKMTPSGLAPERVEFVRKSSNTHMFNIVDSHTECCSGLSSKIDDMRFVSGSTYNILRPELIESLYYLNFYTKDEKYIRWGEQIFDSFVKHAKSEHGFTPLDNVNDEKPTPSGGNQESFWIAETLKYLYLLFAPEEKRLSLREWVFTTEAHPLKIFGKEDGGRGSFLKVEE